MTEYLDDQRRLVSVYRSPRREGMYLYVDRAAGLKPVPEALLNMFGTPQAAMDLLLTPARVLARAKAADVLAAIRDQGFYLQLPPQPDEEMQALIRANDKLGARQP
ncbi:MAG: YcgL domain-containing protein [Pseudomonadota bacterium]